MLHIWMRAALCGLMALGPVTALDAGCGHTVCHNQVVAAVVQPVFVAQFVEVPVYSVTLSGYGNPQPAPAPTVPAPSACEQKLSELQARFDSLAKDFETLKQLAPKAEPKAAPKAAEPKADANPLQTSAQGCFQCHSETAAKASGGSFVLFKGNALVGPDDLPAAKVVKILTLVSETRDGHAQMPPAGNKKGVPPATDAQAAAWHDWASTMKPK